jgi:hypothetical protein
LLTGKGLQKQGALSTGGGQQHFPARDKVLIISMKNILHIKDCAHLL